MLRTDFLPERIRDQRLRRQALKRQVVLMGLCVLGLVVLGFARQGRLHAAQGQLQRLKEQTATVDRQLTFRSELEAQQADLLVKKRIDDELGSRVNALGILAELERMLPKSIFLSSLTLEAVEMTTATSPVAEGKGAKKNAKAKDQVFKRVRMTFTGVAPSDVDVANFIAQLSGGHLFEDVNMMYARNTEFRGQSAREFQAYCFVVR